MGNVYASSQNSNAPFTATPPAPFPEPEKDASENLENPGSMEELHKKCKGMFRINVS